jgi:hypothetical protein
MSDTPGTSAENPEVPATPAHDHASHDPETVVDDLDLDPEAIVDELDTDDDLLDEAEGNEQDPFAAFEDGVAGDDEEG